MGREHFILLQISLANHIFLNNAPEKSDWPGRLLYCGAFVESEIHIDVSLYSPLIYLVALVFICFIVPIADPRDSETLRPVDTHHAMEVRLGLSKGPVAPSFM